MARISSPRRRTATSWPFTLASTPLPGVTTATGIALTRTLFPSVCLVEDLHDVEHLDRRALGREPLGDLDDAAGIGGADRVGPGGPHVGDLSLLQARGHLRLREVVGAGGAAAPVRFLQLDDPQSGDLGEQRPRLRPNLLPVGDVTWIVIGHGPLHRRERPAQRLLGEELRDVAHARREARRASAARTIA